MKYPDSDDVAFACQMALMAIGALIAVASIVHFVGVSLG